MRFIIQLLLLSLTAACGREAPRAGGAPRSPDKPESSLPGSSPGQSSPRLPPASTPDRPSATPAPPAAQPSLPPGPAPAPPAIPPVAQPPAPSPVPGDDDTDSPPPSGPDPVPASGCFSADGDYTKAGPYTWKTERTGSFEVYVPDESDGCRQFPVVGFAMGTGTPPANYKAYYQHMASWGLIVVIDPSNLINLGGDSLAGAMKQISGDPRFQGRLLSAGVIGHSQGGAAVVNVAQGGKFDVQAVVGLMPALFTGNTPVKAAGLYIGGTADSFGAATDPQRPFDMTTGPAFIADMRGQNHTVGSGRGKEAGIMAMSTAWFRCHLATDDHACSLFEDSSRNRCAFPGDWVKCDPKNL